MAENDRFVALLSRLTNPIASALRHSRLHASLVESDASSCSAPTERRARHEKTAADGTDWHRARRSNSRETRTATDSLRGCGRRESGARHSITWKCSAQAAHARSCVLARASTAVCTLMA